MSTAMNPTTEILEHGGFKSAQTILWNNRHCFNRCFNFKLI